MKCLVTSFILANCLLFGCIFAVPVPKATKAGTDENKVERFLPEVSYKQYLSEVVSALENDKEFAERLRHVNSTADMASQLEFASHSVRTRLDEIKRQEVERLNELEKVLEAKKKAQADPGKASQTQFLPNLRHLDEDTIKRAHLDHVNPSTFEISDLEKLINQVSSEMEQVNSAREAEYKRYKMGKEHVRRARLRRIKDQKAREEAERQQAEAERQRIKRHGRLHQPGSREQLKETWEKTDHMDRDKFDMLAFFMMHDVNSDGHLDINEIEALFYNQLDKAYNKSDGPGLDSVERQHEMERMRSFTLNQVDTNRDNMISWAEFSAWGNSRESNQDDEWKAADENESNRPYTDEEFKRFEEDYARKHPGGQDADIL